MKGKATPGRRGSFRFGRAEYQPPDIDHPPRWSGHKVGRVTRRDGVPLDLVQLLAKDNPRDFDDSE